MKKRVNKHLGMDQDELAASFVGRLHSKTKSGKSKKEIKAEIKKEGWGLTDEEIKVWNKKLTAITAEKPKKKRLTAA